MRCADPIGALNSAVSEVVFQFVPTTVVRSRSGDTHWFDSNCHRAYDAKQTAYRAWSRDRGADLWNQFVHSRTEVQRVYGVAMASHNERARRTLTSTMCSHKWWETLKGSIFGEKPSIPALRALVGLGWSLMLRKLLTWVLCLIVNSAVSSLSLLCPVSHGLFVILGISYFCSSPSAA